MEDIKNFDIPEFIDLTEDKGKTKKVPKKETKLILEERGRLPKINRTLRDIYSGEEKIVNPDQYQALYDYWGSHEKIEKNFISKETEMQMRENPIRFWLLHGQLLQNLAIQLKAIYEDFFRLNDPGYFVRESKRLFTENNIALYDFEPLNTQNKTLNGVIIKNIPFVGNILIKPYENRQNRITLGN